jgi:hypothetical protein
MATSIINQRVLMDQDRFEQGEDNRMTFFHGSAKKANGSGAMRKVQIGLMILLLLLWIPVTSDAFVPLVFEGERKAAGANDFTGKAELPVDSWRDFIGEYGGGWRINWDRTTGTPRTIYGSSIEMFPGGIPGESFLVAPLLDFVDEHRGLFRITSNDLQRVNAKRHGRFWYVNFQQVAGAVPVYGGRLQFRLNLGGKLVAISGRIHPEVGPVSSPSLSVERAEAIAMVETGFVEGRDRLMETKLVVYPDGNRLRTDYILSWMVELINREPPAHWFYVIDAGDGTVVDFWNQIYYEDSATDSIMGLVRGSILPETPTDDPVFRPFKDQQVELTSGGLDITDSLGLFLIESPGPGPDSIIAELLGPFVNVDNDSTDDAEIRMEAVVGVPNLVVWQPSNSAFSERNGFYHTIVVHDYMKQIDPSYDRLDYSMPCRVDINQTCNAFWDGFGMNFFRAGGGCANTANIADVIYHEYGHGVTDFQYRPFPQPSGAMHEGFSDYLGATITNQSLIGRGFTGPGSWIRNADNSRIWPAPECGGEPHCVGEVIAGCLWDMRENLVASLGQESGVALSDSLFHYARYALSTYFPDYFIDLLLVDDDDGNLGNGVPHGDEICGGFENHGISCVLEPNVPMVFDVGNGNDLQVVWQPVPQLMAPITDYMLFYGEESGVYSDSMSTAGDTTVTVMDLVEGQVYFFSVVAIDSTGRRSAFSEEGIGSPLSVPLPPNGVASESHAGDITISWFKNRELDIDQYIIYRSVQVDSNFVEVGSVSMNDTLYSDQDVDARVMYYYQVAAKDQEGSTSDVSETVRGRLISLDGGILVIDGTKDGSEGTPFSWSDETVDNFYGDLLSDYPVTGEFDIADSLEESPFALDDATMGLYSTVVWHQDDRTSPSMTPYLDDLGKYLSQGGNLFLCGWQLLDHLSDGSSLEVDFESGSVPHDYLKINSGETVVSSIRDFAGADSRIVDYPDLTVDATKAPLFDGNLFEMDIIHEPLVDEPVTEALYSYRSSNGDTATYHGEIVGLRYLGEDYRLVLFDFPIFYMEQEMAEGVMSQVMEDLEEVVGIAGDGGGKIFIPRAYALHQNYPNPFNPSTAIVVDVPENKISGTRSRTRVAIYSIRGQLVRVLLDDEKEAGRYMLHWDGRNERGENVGSGVYLYRMEAGDFNSIRKMVLMK